MFFAKGLTIIADSLTSETSLVSPLCAYATQKYTDNSVRVNIESAAEITLSLSGYPAVPPYNISNISVAVAERFSQVPRVIVSGENSNYMTIMAFLGTIIDEGEIDYLWVTVYYDGDTASQPAYFTYEPSQNTQYVSAVVEGYNDNYVAVYVGNQKINSNEILQAGSFKFIAPPNPTVYELIDGSPTSLSISPRSPIGLDGKGSGNAIHINATLNFSPFGNLDYGSIGLSSKFSISLPDEIGRNLFGRYYIKDMTDGDSYSLSYTFSDLGFSTNGEITLYVGEYRNGPYDGGESDPDAPGLGPGGVGGNGSFGKNEVSDSITVPNGSAAGDASATGMMTRYLANSSYLEIFGDWLWTTDLGLTIAKSVISLIYGDPAESVISVMSYPFDIRSLSGVTTRNQNLYWGNHNSGLPFIALTSAAATVDWGTISLSEYWGNFLDYEPHTKIELYLPWGTGFVPIDPGQCLPGTLKVVTNIDLNKGSCIHNVFGNNNCVIGTYAGQCSQQIPIMSNDYASKIAGVVTAAAGLATAGASGAISAGKSAGAAFDRYVSDNPIPVSGVPVDWKSGLDANVRAAASSGFKTGARSGANLAANSSVAAARRTGGVSRNGSFTDGSAALGCQYPYIILSRPTQSVPKEYGSHYGYPSNITASLGNLKGYTEVGEIHINGIDATGPELSELEHILKGGVIF